MRENAEGAKPGKARCGKGKGTLVIIGGHEDKEGDCDILREVARHVNGGRLVISTVASKEPEGYFEAYKKAFARLGERDLEELYIADRSESLDPNKTSVLDGCAGIFFTGGDQLRISSQIGDTPFEQAVLDVYEGGGVIAGTSAGASAIAEVMMVRGSGDESSKVGGVHMAPGLGLLPGVIIDQHFAQRGRIGRLLGAIVQNPRLLGIGIDENTAIVVKNGKFTVIGSGAVYIVDGSGVTKSNIAEEAPDAVLSIFDVKLHVLSAKDGYDLTTREVQPKRASAKH